MDPAYPDALPAQTRLHWYAIERVLGQGGFGITYLARDSNLDQRVAIKEYLPVEFATRVADSTIRSRTDALRDRYRWGLERFLQEARTLARFEHPNIVRVLSVFEFNNTAYMVMRFEEGASLAAVLDRRGTLPESELSAIVLPILDGLEQIHAAGFIHRDIKPDNIYLRGNGQPVLLDFGSARQSAGSSHTLTILVAPGYAPFEQYYSDSGNQGPWTDIYSLAATCYRAIAGRTPLDAIARSKGVLGSTQESMTSASIVGAGRYSERFLAAIDHALAFAEKDRPQSIADWRSELVGRRADARALPPAASTPVSAPAPREPAPAAPATRPLESGNTPRKPPAAAPVDATRGSSLRTPAMVAVVGGVLVAGGILAVAYMLAPWRTDTTAEIAALRKDMQDERERLATRPVDKDIPRVVESAPVDRPASDRTPAEPAPGTGGSDRLAAEARPTPASPPKRSTAIPKDKSPVPAVPAAAVPAAAVPAATAPAAGIAAAPGGLRASTPDGSSPSAGAADTKQLGSPAGLETRVAVTGSTPAVSAPVSAATGANLPPTRPEAAGTGGFDAVAKPSPRDRLADARRAYAAGNYADALGVLPVLAAEGNAGAQLLLGEAYAEGRGVARDVTQATSWFERSALQGNTDAMHKLGSMYATIGNRNFAYIWYGCAAKLGSGSATSLQAQVAGGLQPVERTQADRAIESCVAKGKSR